MKKNAIGMTLGAFQDSKARKTHNTGVYKFKKGFNPEFMEFINEMYITYNPFVNVLFNFSTKIYSKLSLLKGKLKKRGEKNDS